MNLVIEAARADIDIRHSPILQPVGPKGYCIQHAENCNAGGWPMLRHGCSLPAHMRGRRRAPLRISLRGYYSEGNAWREPPEAWSRSTGSAIRFTSCFEMI